MIYREKFHDHFKVPISLGSVTLLKIQVYALK